jgi:hypothetical protein
MDFMNTQDIDIVVALAGGLGNRLHTLYSSHYLTIRYGLPLKYYWANDFDSNCTFQDIFDAPFITTVSDDDTRNRIIFNSNDIVKQENLSQKIFWISPFVARYEDSPYEIDWQEAFCSIPIRPEIVDRINSIIIPNNCIAIHVRAGDIKEKLNVDPADIREYIEPKRFLPYIDFYLSLNKDQIFYLSCENYEDEQLFIDEYGKHKFLKLDPCIYNRNTIPGVIDGFTNLILLSKCNTIIGMISSFSGMASKINNKPQIINFQ